MVFFLLLKISAHLGLRKGMLDYAFIERHGYLSKSFPREYGNMISGIGWCVLLLHYMIKM